MIDSRAMVEAILQGLERGVRKSLEDIQTEAQRRAPVRKLFKGGGRRRFASGQVGVRNQLGSERAYFRASREGTGLDGRTIRGRPNSYEAVTAPARRSGVRPIGGAEFRELEREPGYNVAFRFKQANHPVAGREILSRAKSDVRRGRGLHVVPGGMAGVEFGGTLRDSITVVGPRRTPVPGVMGYVKASAIEHGFNYAYAQEFGTSHNPPQPYLRPSLRSLHKKITNTNRDAIRAALGRTRPPVRLVTAGLTLAVVPDRSSSMARFGLRIDRALR